MAHQYCLIILILMNGKGGEDMKEKTVKVTLLSIGAAIFAISGIGVLASASIMGAVCGIGMLALSGSYLYGALDHSIE